jgi:hypothetical protein
VKEYISSLLGKKLPCKRREKMPKKTADILSTSNVIYM